MRIKQDKYIQLLNDIPLTPRLVAELTSFIYPIAHSAIVLAEAKTLSELMEKEGMLPRLLREVLLVDKDTSTDEFYAVYEKDRAELKVQLRDRRTLKIHHALEIDFAAQEIEVLKVGKENKLYRNQVYSFSGYRTEHAGFNGPTHYLENHGLVDGVSLNDHITLASNVCIKSGEHFVKVFDDGTVIENKVIKQSEESWGKGYGSVISMFAVSRFNGTFHQHRTATYYGKYVEETTGSDGFKTQCRYTSQTLENGESILVYSHREKGQAETNSHVRYALIEEGDEKHKMGMFEGLSGTGEKHSKQEPIIAWHAPRLTDREKIFAKKLTTASINNLGNRMTGEVPGKIVTIIPADVDADEEYVKFCYEGSCPNLTNPHGLVPVFLSAIPDRTLTLEDVNNTVFLSPWMYF